VRLSRNVPDDQKKSCSNTLGDEGIVVPRGTRELEPLNSIGEDMAEADVDKLGSAEFTDENVVAIHSAGFKEDLKRRKTTRENSVSRVRMRAATVLGMNGMPQGWEGWQRSRNSEKRDEKTISSNNTTAKTCAGFGDPLRNPRHRASTRDARPAEHRFRAQQPGLYRVHRQERKNHRRVCRHTARRGPPGRAVRARSHGTPGRLGRVHSGPVGLPVPLPLCLSASPICLPLCLSASPTCLPVCLSASLPLCLSASLPLRVSDPSASLITLPL